MPRSNDLTILARFQQTRPPVPDNAEHHRRSDFEVVKEHPSIFIPGAYVRTVIFLCPLCREPIRMEHGDRALHSCGLFMENYGDGLALWLEEEK